MSAKPISVRPAQRVEPKIVRLARELDKSAGQLLADAAEAIIAMIEAPVPRVPRIVTAARVLREHNATFTAEERPFASHLILEEPPVKPGSKTEAASSKTSRAKQKQDARG